jgi:mannosidase alpha-like ER degradation enhancer 2
MTLPVFQSLQAFWPGLLSLVGDINVAMKALYNMHSVWKQHGFLPEMYNIPNAEPTANRESYPLRPELIESVMYLYRATGDPYLLEIGEDILTSIEHSAKTSCGYATIKNVKDHRKQDTMESFFLAETAKYLYLLFDPDNFLNSDGSYGTIIDTKNGECIIESSFIFNTEAHPIDLGALKCCYEMPRESLVKGFDRKKFMGELAIEKMPLDENENLIKTDDEAGEKANEDFKQQLMDEILSALSSANKKLKESSDVQKRFVEMTSRERQNFVDTTKVTVGQEQETTRKVVEGSEENEKLETVRLSSSALDSDDANQSKYDDYDDGRSEENVTTDSPQASKSEAKIIKKSSDKNNNNNSIITDFVKNILKTATTTKQRKKFDPQMMLEKIQNERYGFTRNDTWANKFELFSCKAQTYGNRVSVMGEFY